MSPGAALRLAAAQREALARAAEAAYPQEFCALLIGRDREAIREVTRLVFAANRDPDPARGFELDPAVLIRELRALREAERRGGGAGERLLGHVHSHPDAAPVPSERDRLQAHEPGQVWLIVPVTQGTAGPPRAFLALHDGTGDARFEPIPLIGAAGQETA